MNEDSFDDELSRMYEEDRSNKVLDASAFLKPIKHLRLRKPITLGPNRTVGDAIRLMKSQNVGCVLITEGDRLAGIFTERDVLKRVAGVPGAEQQTLRELMTPKVEGLQPDDSIAFVLNAMHVGGYRHVPITDENGVPLAVLSVKDIVGFLLEHFPDDVINLPPRPVRRTEQREGA